MDLSVNSVIGAMGPIFLVIFWFLVIGIIGFLSFLIYRQLQYKFWATVQQVDGTTNKIRKQWTVKVRKNPKKGRMHLKKFKEWIDIPPNNYWIPHGKSSLIYLQWDGRRLFSAADISYKETIMLEPAYYDAVEDLAKRVEEAPLRHGLLSHWEKYGMYYMVFFIVVAHLFALMMLTDSAPDLKGAGQQALNMGISGGVIKWATRQH